MFVPVHEPEPSQWSFWVHALESLQLVDDGKFVYTHPVEVLQLSDVHALLSLHVTVPPPTQLPEPLQWSELVHAFESSHPVDDDKFVCMQTHVLKLYMHESEVHALLSLHHVETLHVPAPSHVPVPEQLPFVVLHAVPEATLL